MLIDDLIAELAKLRAEHGNIPMWISLNGDAASSLDDVYYADGASTNPEIEAPGIVVLKW